MHCWVASIVLIDGWMHACTLGCSPAFMNSMAHCFESSMAELRAYPPCLALPCLSFPFFSFFLPFLLFPLGHIHGSSAAVCGIGPAPCAYQQEYHLGTACPCFSLKASLPRCPMLQCGRSPSSFALQYRSRRTNADAVFSLTSVSSKYVSTEPGALLNM